MRLIIILFLTASGLLKAHYNPTMRIHFGGSSAIVRMDAGYFVTPLTAQPALSEGQDNAGRNSDILSSMRLGIEGMFMLNNRSHFSESFNKTPPRFLLVRARHDGFEKTVVSSISMAQGLPCVMSLPIFGQIKGYWSAGAASRFYNDYRFEQANAANTLGGRLGFNVYNRNSALQAEVLGFRNEVITNVLIHRKLVDFLLISGGVEYNKPVIGLSAIAGSCRIALSSRLFEKKLQHGINFTANF